MSWQWPQGGPLNRPQMEEIHDATLRVLAAARVKVRDVWWRDNLYRIDDDRALAIDQVVAAAEKALL
jgi:hypothetical protein